MRILLIHTYYHIRGGEDQVFEQEIDLLSAYHTVERLSFQNNTGLSGLLQFLRLNNNVVSNCLVKEKIVSFQPDIIHIHNLHFAAGFGIIDTINGLGVPMVMTLHNYRLLCPSASLFDGKVIFLDSLKSSFPWRAIFKKVYKNSALLTFWLALITYRVNKSGRLNMIDKYIVLTDFAKSIYKKSSLDIDKSKFIVKSNFVYFEDNIEPQFLRDFLFVGRLSEEKGIQLLLKTFIDSNYKLQIAGDGPLLNNVKDFQNSFPDNLEFLGRLSRREILTQMKSASTLVLSSVCYEGMPMTIIEAFSMRLPVIANNLGAMSTMIEDGYNGYLFDGTKEGLSEKLAQWQGLSLDEKIQMKDNAYNSFTSNYTAAVNLIKLEEIYTSLINEYNEKNN